MFTKNFLNHYDCDTKENLDSFIRLTNIDLAKIIGVPRQRIYEWNKDLSKIPLKHLHKLNSIIYKLEDDAEATEEDISEIFGFYRAGDCNNTVRHYLKFMAQRGFEKVDVNIFTAKELDLYFPLLGMVRYNF